MGLISTSNQKAHSSPSIDGSSDSSRLPGVLETEINRVFHECHPLWWRHGRVRRHLFLLAPRIASSSSVLTDFEQYKHEG